MPLYSIMSTYEKEVLVHSCNMISLKQAFKLPAKSFYVSKVTAYIMFYLSTRINVGFSKALSFSTKSFFLDCLKMNVFFRSLQWNRCAHKRYTMTVHASVTFSESKMRGMYMKRHFQRLITNTSKSGQMFCK